MLEGLLEPRSEYSAIERETKSASRAYRLLVCVYSESANGRSGHCPVQATGFPVRPKASCGQSFRKPALHFCLDESLDVQWDNFVNAKFAEYRQDMQLQDRIVVTFRGWLHTFALQVRLPPGIYESSQAQVRAFRLPPGREPCVKRMPSRGAIV